MEEDTVFQIDYVHSSAAKEKSTKLKIHEQILTHAHQQSRVAIDTQVEQLLTHEHQQRKAVASLLSFVWFIQDIFNQLTPNSHCLGDTETYKLTPSNA